MSAVTQVRVENITPVRLVQMVREGRIRLPSFQRDYRWQARDVEWLFDSVRKRYPIGNLLLWERPAPSDRITVGPLVLDVPEVPRAQWVVDGQQRITSLVGALAAPEDVGDPRFSVYAELPSMTFRATLRSPSEDWLPLRVAGSVSGLLRWQREHVDVFGEAELAAADEIAAAMREYQLPVYIIEADDEREVRVVFDRMNNYGRSLTKVEVFDALHGLQETVRPGDLAGVATSVAAAGFGRLADSDVLRTLLALRAPDVFRDVHDEFVDDDDRRTAFAQTEKTLLDVAALMRDELAVPHVRALPYPSTIPLLGALVHRFGRPSGRAVVLLRRWLWRAAALGSNPAGRPPVVRQALRAINAAPSAQSAAQALLRELPAPPRRWAPDLTQVALNRALSRVNLLGLIALEPRDLSRPYEESLATHPALSAADVLDTVEHPLLALAPGRGAATMAGRIFHPPMATDAVGALLAADASTRASHAVDDRCAELLADGLIAQALARRAEVLTHITALTVDRYAEWGAKDGPTAAELLSGPLSA